MGRTEEEVRAKPRIFKRRKISEMWKEVTEEISNMDHEILDHRRSERGREEIDYHPSSEVLVVNADLNETKDVETAEKEGAETALGSRTAKFPELMPMDLRRWMEQTTADDFPKNFGQPRITPQRRRIWVDNSQKRRQHRGR